MTENSLSVYVIDSIAEHAMETLEKKHRVVRFDDPEIVNWPDQAHAIITRTTPITAEKIARSKHLKVIAKHGIGVDHVDLAAAKAKGIPVINTPGTNAQSVSELTVMMAIASARNTRAAEAEMRKGDPGDTFQWRGFEISGRRVGIVGLGNVGRRTAPIFKHGFNCHVTAYDPYIADAPFEQLGIDRALSLEALTASSDILVTHVPLNTETRGMIDAGIMTQMPKGAVIINAARGGVVDEEALFTALTSGHIFAAATDVFVTEPPAIDHPLLTLPNFLATPHIGAATHDSARRSGETVVRYVMDILDGHPPLTAVTQDEAS